MALNPSSSGVQLSRDFLKPFVPDSCSCTGTVALRWSLGDSSPHPFFSLSFFQLPRKRQCYQRYLVPDWEIVPNSNQMAAAASFRERVVRWTTLPGTAVRASVPDHECTVVKKPPYAASETFSLWIRDPECFIAGEIHRHLDVWDKLFQGLSNGDEIMGWSSKKVCIYDFVQQFKGRFGGCTYDSSFPVPRLFHNHNLCEPFAEFISKTITDCIAVGAVGVVGKVGQCAPPSVVMSLTGETSKPRLCQDQRYLNCWMRDRPFRLDSLVDVTCYLEKKHFQTKLDDKSGYDHVLMDDDS